MKTIKQFIPLITVGLTVAAFVAGMFYSRIENPRSLQQLTLEEILSIRELHLVKHTYTDLIFIHRHNDPAKVIRAMVQMPVTVTAYLDLKNVELIYSGDSLRKVVLPRAQVHEPVFHVNNMTVRETRNMQVHAGKDLYPEVVTYLGKTLAARSDTALHLAETNRILLQAEAEGMEYVQGLLHALGHHHIEVTFNDTALDAQVAAYLEAHHKTVIPAPRTKKNLLEAAAIPFGFLPIQ
jgi:hypothetical protein